MGDDNTPRTVTSLTRGNTGTDEPLLEQMMEIRHGRTAGDKDVVAANADGKFECKYVECHFESASLLSLRTHQAKKHLHRLEVEVKPATYEITSSNRGRDTWSVLPTRLASHLLRFFPIPFPSAS